MKLLTVGNTKTVKGEAKGYRTFILHLAPSDLSGYNVCPMASAGCRSACLNTAGRGRFDNTQNARIRKTRMFFENRDAFMKLLAKDVIAAIRNAKRNNLIPVFRLNGTSDLRWENVPLGGFANVMEAFPDYQFYDYTAIPNRRNLPKNYHVTFSKKEDNDKVVSNLVENTMTNIAVVFKTIPATYLGRPVVSGDETDLRFLDPQGIIVALKAKGDAKKDTSGFVVE